MRQLNLRTRLSATRWLWVLIAANCVIREIIAIFRKTPELFPDEYIYSAIARGFAENGIPLVRGHLAHFPAVLYPLLSAPAWVIGSVDTGYRLAQFIGIVIMSLSAWAAYRLAQELGISARIALAVAALTLLTPDFMYSSWIMAETVAYPLATLAVLVVVHSLDKPSLRRQLAALFVLGLLAAARIQFVFGIPLYLVAVLIVACRERSITYLRSQLLPFLVLITATIIVGAVGLSTAAGYYSGAVHGYPILAVLGWAGRDGLALAYSCGWAIIPGALIGLAGTIIRPRSRLELAFGAFAIPFVLSLLGESAAYSLAGRIQERYLFYATPLLAIAFCLYLSRSRQLRPVHAALALALIIPSAVVRLADYVFGYQNDGSPLLLAANWAQTVLNLAAPDLLFLIACLLALALALVPMIVPRSTAVVGLGASIILCSLIAAGAVGFDLRNTTAAKPNPSWVDHTSRSAPVTLLSHLGSSRLSELSQLFWNRSIRNVTVIPGGVAPDVFGATHARIARDGSIFLGTQPLRGDVVLGETGETVRLVDAKPLGVHDNFKLWQPSGNARLAYIFNGRSGDSSLLYAGSLTLYSRRQFAGTLTLHLHSVSGAGRSAQVQFHADGRLAVTASLKPAAAATVNIPVCGQSPFIINFAAVTAKNDPFRGAVVVNDGQLIVANAGLPRYVPDPSACTAKGSHR